MTRSHESASRPPAARLGPTVAVLAGLSAVLTASWAAVAVTGGDTTALIEAGAKVDAWVDAGDAWRLVLSPFLHLDAGHVAANAVLLVLLGLGAGRLAGALAVFAAAVLAGVGGHTASWLAAAGPSVGASGAVLGLAGLAAVAGLSAARREGAPARGPAVAAAAAALAALVGVPLLADRVDHAAHLGGLAIGLAVGALLARRPGLDRPLAAAAAALLLAGAAGAWLDDGPPLASAALAPAPGDASLPLPALGAPGHVHGDRCLPGDAPPGAAPCTALGWELLAAAGPLASVAGLDPAVAAHLPPPGRCLRYTAPGESVLLIRVDEARLIALGVARASWDRFAPLRRALSAGRCPGS